MKKSLIATGGATLAVAAMPAVAVFAATSSSFVDSLTVTVNGGCTMETSATTTGVYEDRQFSGSLDAGTKIELNGGETQTGPTMTVSCNTSTGTWTVQAVASNGGNLQDTNSHTIAPGVAITGATSGWAIKSNATNATTNPYSAYKAYVVDSGKEYSTFLSGNASGTAATFNPSYQIYASPTQAPATYTGTVTYTIVLGS